MKMKTGKLKLTLTFGSILLTLFVMIYIAGCEKKADTPPEEPKEPPVEITKPEMAIPMVDYEYEVNALTVKFTPALEDANRIFWEFGDGTSSEELSPSHTYQFSGRYRAKLTAYNDSIVSDSLFTESNYSKDRISVSVIDHVRWGTKQDPLNGLTISWRSKSIDDKIEWGYSESLEMGSFTTETQIDKVGNFDMHSYTFENLLPSSTIHYRLYDSNNDTWTEVSTFKTAPDPAHNKFKFSAGGDSRTNLEDWQSVADAIEVCDFSLYLGDIVNNGNIEPDWEKWYRHGENFISNNLVFHVRGNHDIGKTFPNNMINPGNSLYYSFEYGNTIIIGLDDYETDTWEAQTAFLEETLEVNKDKTWKFIFFHSPFFTSEGHEGEMDPLIPTWWKLFDDYGVDFIINAHEHNYLRTVPINLQVSDTSGVEKYGSGPGEGRCQIIAGSYGAPRYSPHVGWFVDNSSAPFCYTTFEVDGNNLKFQAIDTDTGVVFDELTLTK